MYKLQIPGGISSLQEIRRRECYYVDKTAHILHLIQSGKYYFLSRPRRFGKTLLVDTLRHLFEGNEELFRGLYIHDRWDWSKSHPVVRISFGGRTFTQAVHLEWNLNLQLRRIERRARVEALDAGAPERLAHLIETLHEEAGQQVVILIDEYDKPILDAMATPDIAQANRDFLRGFYGVIKEYDEEIRFAFITGVSKFSKAGLFSGLNNLRDITLSSDYGTICGYTEYDLDTVFAPELEDLDRKEIRRWYNGYNWRGSEKVYNPTDILLLFEEREFRTHWFETGTPKFLIETLFRRKQAIPVLENLIADDDLLSAFDIEEITIEALMFQTGYLTIVDQEKLGSGIVYRLGYPNLEVQISLNRRLLRAFLPDLSGLNGKWLSLHRRTMEGDLKGVKGLFEAFFSGIPYEWHMNNDIARYEGYWASLFYAYFSASELDVRVEESTAHGRLDMVVVCPKHVHIYEFKMVDREPDGSALAQMRERAYANKYRHLNVPIRLIGIEFSREERNIAAFTVETA